MNIAIIGAGVAGLAAAYRLSQDGHQVTLFERGLEIGGQVATFKVSGERLEKYYHHIFTSDGDIIRLLDDLGLSADLQWRESKVGLYHGGRIYDFVTPKDLLSFSPLSLINRLRLGFVTLYLRRYKNWRKLEGTTAAQWIRRYAGQRNHDVVWGPLLRGKFGERAPEIGMVWFWGKIFLRFASRSRGMQKELLGYLAGSFGRMVDVLGERITEAGGKILTNTAVERILTEDGRAVGLQTTGAAAGTYHHDAIIATVPSPAFLKIAPPLPEDYAEKLRKARYQTAVVLILVLNRPLSHIYWLNISDPETPFVAAIEQTNFIDPSRYGGKHIVYLSNYLGMDSPLYGLDREELLARYLPSISKINPRFEPSWIEECHLFRDPAGQPIITTNYSAQIPQHRTPIPGLYLANTTQIYPEDRGMNYSIRLGLEVSKLINGRA